MIKLPRFSVLSQILVEISFNLNINGTLLGPISIKIVHFSRKLSQFLNTRTKKWSVSNKLLPPGGAAVT